MSLLKEDRRTCLEDERAPGFGRRIDITMTLSQLSEAVCPKVDEDPHSSYRSGLLCWRQLLQHRGRVSRDRPAASTQLSDGRRGRPENIPKRDRSLRRHRVNAPNGTLASTRRSARAN